MLHRRVPCYTWSPSLWLVFALFLRKSTWETTKIATCHCFEIRTQDQTYQRAFPRKKRLLENVSSLAIPVFLAEFCLNPLEKLAAGRGKSNATGSSGSKKYRTQWKESRKGSFLFCQAPPAEPIQF